MEPTTPAPPEPRPALWRRAVRFGLVGGTGVLVNLGLLALFVERFHFHYALASVLAIELSILTNYVLNHFWTWRDGDRGLHTFLNYQLVSLVGMAIQWAILTAGVAWLHLYYLLAAAAGIGVATIWNFAANHWFTFARKSAAAARRHRTVWLYVAAALVQLVLAGLLIHSWDGFVFKRTVENFVDHGETPYATAESDPAYAYANAQVPAFSQWYAYPPLTFLLQSLTYGPYFALGGGNQIIARLLLKAPLVVAALVAPLVAARLARSTGASPDASRRLEKLLLFNPLLLIIGAAWGQTEILIGALMVGSVYLVHRERLGASGLLFGLACTVKIFPLFVYPLLLAFLWGRHGARRALLHAAIAGATLLAVCLPFAWPHPHGFFQLVIGMHLLRPSGGFSLWSAPEWFVEALAGPGASRAVGLTLSAVTLLAYLLFLATQCVRAFRLDLHVPALAHRMGIAFLAFLLESKVVHEQYLGLAAFLLFTGALLGPVPRDRLVRSAAWFSLAASAAALVRGFQFVMLIPPDEARTVFGTTAPEMIEAFRRFAHLDAGIQDFITQTLGMALLVVTAARIRPLWRAIRESLHDLNVWVHRIPRPVPQWTSRKLYTTVVALTLILVPSAAVGILFPSGAPQARLPPAPLGNQVVGAYYEVWWRNPSNDPYQQYGNWLYATTTPASGFYSSRTGLFEEAIAQMKGAGVDFALVPVNTRDTSALRAFAFQAEQQGFRYTFLFDLRWTDAPTDRIGHRTTDPVQELPLTKDSFDHIRRYLGRIDALAASNHLLQLDGRPVLFLQGLDAIRYNGTRDEERDVAQRIIDQADPDALDTLLGSDAWRDRPELLDPLQNAHHPRLATLEALWTNAQHGLLCDGWRDALTNLLARAPNMTFIVDASYDASRCFPGGVAGHFDAFAGPQPTDADPLAADVRFHTLVPSFNATLLRPEDPLLDAAGGAAYVDSWTRHARDPYLLLYAWNAHQEGAAIEPTLQYGDLFLEATTRWTHYGESLRAPNP